MSARQPIKVIQVVASLALGGAERVALELAAGLKAPEWATGVLCLGTSHPATAYEQKAEEDACRRGIPIHRIAFDTPFRRGDRRRLAEFLEAHRPDVLHVHNRPIDWQVAALARALGVRAIYSVHLPYELTTTSQRLLYRLAGRLVPAVVCVSNAVATHVLRSEAVPPQKLRVIHNGIDTSVFAPVSAEHRRTKRVELGWRDDEFIWICAARLDAQKGHEFLLEAFARRPPEPPARLVIVGDGPLRGDLTGRAARLGLARTVDFLGTRRDIPALLEAADGYACASRQEGHPLALLEAMAVGLRVVAPRLSSITEISLPGTPVFYGPELALAATEHDPNAILDALSQVEREARSADTDSVARVARERRGHVARRFSIPAMMTAHQELYRAVARRQGPAALFRGRVVGRL